MKHFTSEAYNKCMNKEEVIEIFKSEVSALGVDLNERQLGQFAQFYDLLIEKNSVMNLTRITEFDEVYFKHFYDSLSILKLEKIDGKSLTEIFSSNINILDLGTGAGFPGVPLKIAFPKINITFADSVNKKLNFIFDSCKTIFADEISEASELEKSDDKKIILKDDFGSINIIHGRAEDLGHRKDLREHYDFVVSRAVANLSTLSEYCLPFVRTGGHFISYKSSDCRDEIFASKNAVKILGGEKTKELEFNLPYDYGDRLLIDIKKNFVTKSKFPRKAPLPSKQPLK